MKHTINKLIFMLSSIICCSVLAASPERVLWEKVPISVHIQKGEERIIHFPDEIRYWLPDSIKQKVSVIAASGVLYIQSFEEFPKTRIRVQGLSDQQIYLLDISSSDLMMTSSELIVMTPESVINRSQEVEPARNGEDWRVRLTRYAARQLYAREGLAGTDSAVQRIPLPTTSSIPLIRGNLIETVPIGSWRGNGLTVTAVRLQNQTDKSYRLRFEEKEINDDLNLIELLRGDWLTATLQHDTVGAKGQDDDSTVLYLVSSQSFEESLGWLIPAISLHEEADNG